MTVTLELTPDVEKLLSENATYYEQSLTDYLLTMAMLDHYTDLSLSDEVLDIIRDQIAARVSGDTGVSWPEFHVGMMAKIERNKARLMAKACL